MATTIPKSWLTHLPQSLIDDTEAFFPIHQGRADTGILNLSSGQQVFVKHSESNAVSNERQAIKWLSQQRIEAFIVPSLLYSDAELIATEYLQGQPLSPRLTTHVERKKLAAALCQIHLLKGYEHGIERQPMPLPQPQDFELALQSHDCPTELFAPLCSLLQQALDAIEQLPAFIGFIHGDLTPDNLMMSNEQLVILDWELAAVRDVRWDLATVIEEFALSRQQQQQWLEEYMASFFFVSSSDQSACRHEFIAGLEAWRVIYLVVCYMWAQQEGAKQQVSRQQDTAKYFAMLKAKLR